jgi:hypothetical protein
MGWALVVHSPRSLLTEQAGLDGAGDEGRVLIVCLFLEKKRAGNSKRCTNV